MVSVPIVPMVMESGAFVELYDLVNALFLSSSF